LPHAASIIPQHPTIAAVRQNRIDKRAISKLRNVDMRLAFSDNLLSWRYNSGSPGRGL
jgi:hypothetical protein